eukprot:3787849-Rhodomonas_salina.1
MHVTQLALSQRPRHHSMSLLRWWLATAASRVQVEAVCSSSLESVLRVSRSRSKRPPLSSQAEATTFPPANRWACGRPAPCPPAHGHAAPRSPRRCCQAATRRPRHEPRHLVCRCGGGCGTAERHGRPSHRVR